jgi:hypothetical protein
MPNVHKSSNDHDITGKINFISLTINNTNITAVIEFEGRKTLVTFHMGVRGGAVG